MSRMHMLRAFSWFRLSVAALFVSGRRNLRRVRRSPQLHTRLPARRQTQVICPTTLTRSYAGSRRRPKRSSSREVRCRRIRCLWSCSRLRRATNNSPGYVPLEYQDLLAMECIEPLVTLDRSTRTQTG